MNNFKSYSNLFWQLVKTDLVVFKQGFVEKLIDTVIWVTSIVAVVTYVFPKLGMSQNYGEFYAVGAVVSAGLFHTFPKNAAFVADITGAKTINYEFTLPLPSWLVILKQACVFACETIAFSIIIIPLSKLILWNRMDLSNFSVIKFVFMFIFLNVFMGLLSIFTSSFVKDIHSIELVWTRILFPLWFFGSTQYSWYTLYKISPKFAYVLLLNPIVYLAEGIQNAVLGTQGRLPFGICLFMTFFFGIIFGVLGIYKLKRRLDFV